MDPYKKGGNLMTPNPQNPEILSHPTPGKSGLGLSYQCENYRVVVSGPGAVSGSHDIFWHNSFPSFLAPAGPSDFQKIWWGLCVIILVVEFQNRGIQS